MCPRPRTCLSQDLCFSNSAQPASQPTISRTKTELASHPHPRLRPRQQHQRRLLRRRWSVTFLREQIFLGQQTGPAPTASHTPPTALGRGPPAAGEPVSSSATQSSPSMPASSTAGRGPLCSPDLCSVPSKPPGWQLGLFLTKQAHLVCADILILPAQNNYFQSPRG